MLRKGSPQFPVRRFVELSELAQNGAVSELVDPTVRAHKFTEESRRLQDVYLCLRTRVQIVYPEHCNRERVDVELNILHLHGLKTLYVHGEEDPVARNPSGVTFATVVIGAIPIRPFIG